MFRLFADHASGGVVQWVKAHRDALDTISAGRIRVSGRNVKSVTLLCLTWISIE